MSSEELLKRQKAANERLAANVQKLNEGIKEVDRVINCLEETPNFLEERERLFEEKTKLNSKDIQFLFFAVAMQCCRCFLQPKIKVDFEKVPKELRHSAQKDGNLEFSKGKKWARKFPNEADIFLQPVPYDAMAGTEAMEILGVTKEGKSLCGYNHHVATLGHDPILGYFFGTVNILSRTITFNTALLDTNEVYIVEGANRKQFVGPSIGFVEAFNIAVESAKEDVTRVIAAIVRQGLHIQSDKYTKQGLPIPFIAPDKAQELLKKGWNSNELERLQKLIMTDVAVVGIQATSSILINLMIETLYKMCYFENDGKNELYEVKIRRILSYSNAIASGSNIIQTVLTENINNLDVGGLIVTIHRIVTDKKFIAQIKEEFIFGEYRKQIIGNFEELNFLH